MNDMKAFYANSEVRTVNHLYYQDKAQWLDELKQDSDTYNYIIAPAGVYTRMSFPMAQIADSIIVQMRDPVTGDTIKRPYVNKAQVRVSVENVFSGSKSEITRNDWLQPSNYMLLIKESSMERFFAEKELPTDTCALLGQLTQDKDADGNTIYYYSYDMSDFISNWVRDRMLPENQRKYASDESILNMLLVPVSVGTSTSSSTTVVSSVRQQQTMSATKIKSAKNGMQLEMVYSGF